MKKLISALFILAASAGIAHADNTTSYLCQVNGTTEQAVVVDINMNGQESFTVFTTAGEAVYKSPHLTEALDNFGLKGTRDNVEYASFPNRFAVTDHNIKKAYGFINCREIDSDFAGF
ncbi:hypothetical protein ACEOHC_003864 [Salmonella enterica]